MKKHILLLLACCLFFSCKTATEKKVKTPVKILKPKSVYAYGFNLDNFKIVNDTIKKGESFGVILDRHHVLYPKINKIATTIKDTFDVRRIRSGKKYTVLTSKDSLQKARVFIYKHNKVDATIINFNDSIISAYQVHKKITTIEKQVSGKISSNLSVTMDSLGLKASLTNTVADIYAWTLDFYSLQKGDSFKLIYDEKFINDTTFVGYGAVKAAVFNHKGENLYAYKFVGDSISKTPEFYNENGNMLRRAFLKSPIKFQYRISSRYNLRRKIALYGRVRPHKGTDFAAKYGTPIMTTASGTVIASARRGGNGNYVKVQHNTTYTTQYLHMKKRNVKVGDYVKQGAIIGWVGMTGNTSGPHVCYRFWKNGKQVDPFRQKLPTAEPLDAKIKPRYFEFIKPLKIKLDAISLIQKDTIYTSSNERKN
ncbi:peptidoglycan DD-metalloendopeptidase family protein [Tenacibaculum finnmarkense]|uniref:peptidoglycan DD-metalloendopeptidase family protein n=1 Tax=Tenacibaculum finnmarkense TaxID=2781243 RepID=UPI001E59D495|nr:peptidoglycan DD-metalloendopeptidase family protein [Tenacibaculum finnmarkense]MCD8412577.1 peptidoglycan DD-metalloendopeptidase family protein [Tenacibaculum finnmarkense genomovar ulcerans]MCG8722414.1 peptidoglycan DD-metalloendopeptidase family protein [Tenacibaculum finnmarkense]MCG8740673.1 peptidoglycan DD-metalloendopeptidase family protein [Tenacibaculum finnmarkense]MCG8764083.1 peptidoglycan DD-metalloendopeptidase family protein [Tenacibaculum finnmarkense]MCG8776939.1 peptid